jgi:hypothetical protein
MELTDRQQHVLQTFRESNFNIEETARQVGVASINIIKTLFYAARKGASLTSGQTDSDKPDFLPSGWSSKSKSILHRPNGEVVMVWDKASIDEQGIEELWKTLENHTPVMAHEIPGPETFNEKLMLEWLLMDHHLGLHAWGKETGEDYDTDIAKDLIIRAAKKIYAGMKVKKTVLVFGGDNTHADNRSNQTEKSRHSLDVDTRYPKTMNALYTAIVTAIDIALGVSETAIVVVVPGNHYYHSAICLAIILAAHYRNNDRVKIDTTPAKHKYIRFGSNYFMYTHGDTGGAKLSGFMMNHIIKQGLQGIERMYVRKGHLHKRGKVVPPGLTEEDGVIIETFPTLAAADSFAHEHAYVSTRATVANLWHADYGQRSRMELGVKELMED